MVATMKLVLFIIFQLFRNVLYNKRNEEEEEFVLLAKITCGIWYLFIDN